jgi:two-component system sensor histidine kinase HydH
MEYLVAEGYRGSPADLPAGPATASASDAEGSVAASGRAPGSFNLLRWFSIVSLAALIPVAAVTGTVLSRFITTNALQRDAELTAEFIRNCLGVEAAQIRAATLTPFLDPRGDARAPAAGLTPAAVAQARAEVFEHLETLPDTLLTSVYAPDLTVVWSTNRALVGRVMAGDGELKEAFAARSHVARYHTGSKSEREERLFVVQPKEFFIENYIPLTDLRGKVVAVVEVYKEPHDLMAAIRTGQAMVWATTLGGGLLIYLGLFSIIRRGSRLLEQQQRQLMDQEAQLFAGEMATALAHSLRNPLASVRSSAELAQYTEDLPVRKNAQDIITQVDFLSQWVRELLLYSRPLTGEKEPVNLCAILDGVLGSFGPAFERAGVRIAWDRANCKHPLVVGNTSLVTQALHSVISNAVEAMPRGGEIRIEVRESRDPAGVDLLVSDTGTGMSRQQLATAFRPFQTTKPHGLGVGLPMVKRAMERFGGFVALASLENRGTQVRLHFKT